MTMYNKIFTKILDSSVWLEPTPTRIVWITMIAAMDEVGFCPFAAVGNVASRARVTEEEAKTAIDALEAPDPESSDQDNEGRRIERVPGGWIVINAPKYRALVTRVNVQERTRERVRRFREKKRIGNAPVTQCNDQVTPSESESDTKAKAKEQKPSRAKREPKSPDGMKHSTDHRHVACKGAIFDYYRKHCEGEDPDWDGREGKALAMFLSANPKLTDAGLKRLLDHRARSDVNHADRPSKWIGSLKSYLNGPLNEFGKPKGAGNGNGLTKGERLKQAAAEAIAELEHDYAVANGTGDAEAGESR